MQTTDLELQIASQSKQIVMIAVVVLIFLVTASILLRDRVPKLKPWLFGALSATLILPTIYMIGSTIYLNTKSESGGPVHWHAEVEFWACGTELDLRNPTGFLSNKVGTSTYHEHDDKHIHLEGVVLRKSEDASLGKFLRVTGGHLDETGIGVPLSQEASDWTVDGEKLDGDAQGTMTQAELESYVTYSPDGPVAELRNGGTCNGQPAQLQAFVYSFNKQSNTYSQKKITDPADYVIRDESSLGPPADCIIFEYDSEKDRTDKLCEQYGVRDVVRCESFGVKPDKKEVCDISEVEPEELDG